VCFAAQSKPKIQRIVWEDDRNVTASVSPSSGGVVAQGTVMPLFAGSTERGEHIGHHHPHRGVGVGQSRSFTRASSLPPGVFRGGPGSRHAGPRPPMMQPSAGGMRQRTPGGGMLGQRQVARRARGRSPGAPRQQFY